MTYSSEVLADSPLAYYRLGESSGTTLVDSSGNGHDGAYDSTGVTLGATSLITTDAANTAATFGSSHDAVVSTGTWMDAASATATLEGWFKTTNTGAGTIAARWSAAGQGRVIALDLQTSNGIRAYVTAGGSVAIASATITGLRDGNPHHIVGTYDGSNVRLYVDGTLRATTAATGSLDASTEDFTIASRDGATYFTGTLDEIAFYSTALSGARVTAHYAAATTAPTPTATLAGTLQAKTAMFTVMTVAAASLAGVVQPKTAAFTVEAHPVASLVGTLQQKTASFVADIPSGPDRTTSLAGELQPKAGAFTVLGGASSTLAGTLQAKTGAFTAEAVSVADRTISLAGSLRRKTSAITVVSTPAIRLAASLRRKTGAFTADAQPTATLAGTLQHKLATFVTYVVTPVTPAPAFAAGHSVLVAQAFGAVTMSGPRPSYTISEASTPRARQRVICDGVDITYMRGGILPPVDYTLLEPLLYGPASMELPMVAACFERPGIGDLSWLRPGATVEVQRVIDDIPVGTDWKGIVVAFDTSGRGLRVELGGEANGRAALRNRQVPIFPRINDIGHQMADAITDLGLPHYPHLGAVTGIETMTAGGTGHLDHINDLVSKAWTRAGAQWTIMPNPATGAYETHRKDVETIDGTVFIDDAKTVANLRRDIAEEPNRIYVTCVTPAGMRVRFGVYPELVQGVTPDFPGHMEEGDTGEGVRLLIGKLHATGYLKLTETEGGFDSDVTDAVIDLQVDAGLFDEGFTGTAVPGEVNLVTWNALYDVAITGTALGWAHIEPAAQRRKVRPWNRSATGTILGENPLYDPNHLVRDRNIDLGPGVNRSQAREFARTVLHDSDDANWVGEITFHTGALIRGDGFEGMAVTEADVMDAREIRPGMNLDLPQFDGGTLVHVSAVQVNGEGIVTATVDTRARDAMEVWDVIKRNAESRRDPSRQRNRKHRASTIVKDSIGEWDEIGGLLGVDIDLDVGWNVFPVVAAMEGTISRLRLILDNPDEFACAVFGRSITADRLNNLIPLPLTESGTKDWERDAIDDVLQEHWILYSAGTMDEPCGYGRGRKQDDDPLTGVHNDRAGFAYRSDDRTQLWVAVWVDDPNLIETGRIMWPQLEAGV